VTLYHLPTLAKHPERLPLRVDLRIRDREGRALFRRASASVPATLESVKLIARTDPARGRQRWLVWKYKADDPAVTTTSGRMLAADCRRYFLATLDDWRLKAPGRDRTLPAETR
jgi:hypothetical protein